MGTAAGRPGPKQLVMRNLFLFPFTQTGFRIRPTLFFL
ncbi:hypothetical protein Hsw_2706 [Hymenobacter swuensis DY53]|uniref:Uncharacterized protein n=1 Tax=Hymenobacter swuensis DY53 TaxID=1227739 RepID=W8F6Q1_9BACT|nr:hypothetical protein Hsw_2706 [Hymenobacter swuensis DY53]